MTVKLEFEMPEDALAALRKDPGEFMREMRLAAAVKWFELGLVSQSKAAEIADVSRQVFLDSLGRFGVSPFQTTPGELEEEARRG